MTDKRNGVPTLRAAVSDWLGKFAAYRLDCLSKGIWRESDEFIWDSTAPIVDALRTDRDLSAQPHPSSSRDGHPRPRDTDTSEGEPA